MDSNSFCKDLVFPHAANLAQKLPYLVRVRFFVNGVALVELLNSLDSRSSKLAMDAYFIFMVRTTTRKAETRRFYCCASFLGRFKIVCQATLGHA